MTVPLAAMRMLLAALALAAVPGGGLALAAQRGTLSVSRSAASAHAAALAQDLEAEAAPTAIQRVVQLLREMKGQLEQEATTDQETYGKMVCWCKTNEKEKTEAIANAETQISDLETEVAQNSGRGAELATKIDILKKELVEKKDSFNTAVSLREKEHAAFQSGEVELVQGVAMLRNAIQVLSKHHGNMLQVSPGLRESLGAVVRWASEKAQEMELSGSALPASGPHGAAALLSLGGQLASKVSTSQDRLRSLRLGPSTQLPIEYAAKVLAEAAAPGGAQAFVQESAAPGSPASYSSQSGGIFGILKQLAEEFEGNLDQSQKEDLKAQESFAGLKSALEVEIATSTAKLDELEAEFGQNTKALSDAKEDLTTTRETRSEDVKFLSVLRVKCQDLDHQHEQRSKARGEEIVAVGDAIAILTEDDARTLFIKKQGVGTALLQFASSSQEEQKLRTWASALLMRAAEQLRTVQTPGGHGTTAPEQLTAVALQVQLDPFTEVHKAIDDMVVQLKEEQKTEVDHKAFCTKSLNENDKESYHTQQTLADLEGTIASLTAEIEKMSGEIAQAHEAISQMEVQVKAASELRKRENAEFQEEVTDQRAVQNIVAKAIKRLRQVYKEGSLLQGEPAPPAHFQPYKQNAGSSPVIGLMEQVVEDSKAAEQDAEAAEQAAQSFYAQFVNDSQASIKGLNVAIEEKTKMKAQAEIEKNEQDSDRVNTADKLDSLKSLEEDLHSQCDFVLKNFAVRQEARLAEIEALGKVKALLSGMSTGSAA